jgi:Flp pilus assembly pilin Flp
LAWGWLITSQPPLFSKVRSANDLEAFSRITMNPLKRFFTDKAGNATEYALIVSLISIAIAAGAIVMGKGLNALYHAIAAVLP